MDRGHNRQEDAEEIEVGKFIPKIDKHEDQDRKLNGHEQSDIDDLAHDNVMFFQKQTPFGICFSIAGFVGKGKRRPTEKSR